MVSPQTLYVSVTLVAFGVGFLLLTRHTHRVLVELGEIRTHAPVAIVSRPDQELADDVKALKNDVGVQKNRLEEIESSLQTSQPEAEEDEEVSEGPEGTRQFYSKLLQALNELRTDVRSLGREVEELKEQSRVPVREVVEVSSETAASPSTDLSLNDTRRMLLSELEEGPKNYRDIQQQTDLSREHISRELKTLYDHGLVDRDESKSPYVYRLPAE